MYILLNNFKRLKEFWTRHTFALFYSFFLDAKLAEQFKAPNRLSAELLNRILFDHHNSLSLGPSNRPCMNMCSLLVRRYEFEHNPRRRVRLLQCSILRNGPCRHAHSPLRKPCCWHTSANLYKNSFGVYVPERDHCNSNIANIHLIYIDRFSKRYKVLSICLGQRKYIAINRHAYTHTSTRGKIFRLCLHVKCSDRSWNATYEASFN